MISKLAQTTDIELKIPDLPYFYFFISPCFTSIVKILFHIYVLKFFGSFSSVEII